MIFDTVGANQKAAIDESSTSDAVLVPADKEKGHLLITRLLNDLVIHGITSNRIWIFLGALAPFYQTSPCFASASLQRGALEAVNQHLVVPSVTDGQSSMLLHEAYPTMVNQGAIESITYRAISKYYLMRYVGLFTVIVGVMATTFAISSSDILLQHPSILWGILGCYGWGVGMLVLRWYRWEWALDDSFLYVRKGCLGKDFYCVPLHKIQQCQFHQSILLRRKGLGSLTFVTASGVVTLPFLTTQQANLVNQLVQETIEHSDLSWM